MHRQIVAIRDEGVAVVIVSSELDEVIGTRDRRRGPLTTV